MKAVKSTRFNDDQFAGETTKRGTKLTPNKKSGKERHHLYQSLESDEDDDFEEYIAHPKESVLDYIDDGQEDDFDDFDQDDDFDAEEREQE